MCGCLSFLGCQNRKILIPDFVSPSCCTGCCRVLTITTNIIQASNLSGCQNVGGANTGCGCGCGCCCGCCCHCGCGGSGNVAGAKNCVC